jgi:hypothetical protein
MHPHSGSWTKPWKYAGSARQYAYAGKKNIAIVLMLVLLPFRSGLTALKVRAVMGTVAEAGLGAGAVVVGLGAAVAWEDEAATEGKDALQPTRPCLHH